MATTQQQQNVKNPGALVARQPPQASPRNDVTSATGRTQLEQQLDSRIALAVDRLRGSQRSLQSRLLDSEAAVARLEAKMASGIRLQRLVAQIDVSSLRRHVAFRHHSDVGHASDELMRQLSMAFDCLDDLAQPPTRAANREELSHGRRPAGATTSHFAEVGEPVDRDATVPGVAREHPLVARALEAMDREAFHQALGLLEALEQIAPRTAGLSQAMGRALLGVGLVERAREYFNSAAVETREGRICPQPVDFVLRSPAA